MSAAEPRRYFVDAPPRAEGENRGDLPPAFIAFAQFEYLREAPRNASVSPPHEAVIPGRSEAKGKGIQ